MKSIFLISVMLLIFSISQAQVELGITLGAQIPTGDLSNGTKTGFGLNAVGKYFIQENIALGLNLGYSKFETDAEGVSFSIVPVTGLFEYYFNSQKVRPYVGADIGAYSFGAKVEYMGINESDSKIYFGFAPTGGLLCRISDQLSFCANLKYHYVTSEGGSSTWLGINAGVVIKLK